MSISKVLKDSICIRAAEIKRECNVVNPIAHLAEEFELDRETIRYVLKHACIVFGEDWKGKYYKKVESLLLSLPNGVLWSDKIPTFKFTDCMIASDWHIPCHDVDMVMRMLDTADKYEQRILIIPGDFIDMESLFDKDNGYQPNSLKEEIDTAKKVLRLISSHFDRIIYTEGNHDRRIKKYLQKMMRYANAVKGGGDLMSVLNDQAIVGTPFDIIKSMLWITGLEIYDAPYCMIENSSGKWMVVHPVSYSMIPPQVERDLAAIHHCHVVGTHGHLFAVGFDKSGEYLAAQIGGLFDDKRMWYKQMQVTRHPKANKGYAMLKDSRLYLFPEGRAYGS